MSDTSGTSEKRASITPLVDTAIYLGVLWWILHPELQDAAAAKVERYRRTARNRLSVWRAYNEIRSLPETGEQ
jgi:hypothetical protein